MGRRAAMASKQVMPPGLDSMRLARAMYFSTWVVKGTASMFSYLPSSRWNSLSLRPVRMVVWTPGRALSA